MYKTIFQAKTHAEYFKTEYEKIHQEKNEIAHQARETQREVEQVKKLF